ncbi:hypothetical protein [Rhizobium sp. SYY.PMSO]|uniref:hypothetical protein n=1 Tax=Rhizobium sp. SYY.PMSO TaxID=3382192 RepID=UPI00398FD8DD
MPRSDLDERGRIANPRLREFNRYIKHGMAGIIHLVIEKAPGDTQSVQFSLTPEQCCEIAENLLICAQVIEYERPPLRNSVSCGQNNIPSHGSLHAVCLWPGKR